MSKTKPIWSDFTTFALTSVVLFTAATVTVTLLANQSFAQTNGNQSSVRIALSDSGHLQSTRRSRPTETVTLTDQTNQGLQVTQKTTFSDQKVKSRYAFSDSPAPAPRAQVRQSIGDVAQIPGRKSQSGLSTNQTYSILNDDRLSSFNSSSRRSRPAGVKKSNGQSTPSPPSNPAKTYGETVAAPPVPQTIRTADNRDYLGNSSANAVPAPRKGAVPGQKISGTRLIESSLSNMKLVKAKQFLSQKPEFEDPKDYLSKRKVAESKKPKLSPPKSRRQSQARSRSRSRSAKKRDVARVKISDDAFLNPISDVQAPISPVPFGNIRRYDRKLLVQDANYTQPALADGFNYAQLTHNEFIPSSKAWLAPNFAHNPLYFEETQLERYGNRRPLQLFHSGLHFFGTLPILPYKMGADHPYECQYTYGTYRPGDCVPYDLERQPLDKKGLLNQALWTTAIAVPH